MRRTILTFISLLMLGTSFHLSAQYQSNLRVTWIEPGAGGVLPEFDAFDSTDGTLGVLNASGEVNTDQHPFFTPLGTNGRACVNCHQPAWAMSISAAELQQRWNTTN